MIGRAAQGRPWIFREIAHFLATGAHLPPPTVGEARALIVEHLHDHYAFYGEEAGVRIARKHLGWYTASRRRRRVPPRSQRGGDDGAQLAAVGRFFGAWPTGERLVYRAQAPGVVDAAPRSAGPRPTLRGGEALAA